MPNLAALMRNEVTRLARKEVKAGIAQLQKSNQILRTKVNAQKKQLTALENRVSQLEKNGPGQSAKSPSTEAVAKARITGRTVIALRRKLGLSRPKLAMLLSAHPNTILYWETGRNKPNAEAKVKIIQLRRMGKREISRKLKGK